MKKRKYDQVESVYIIGKYETIQLRKRMKKLSLTQQDLANQVGINRLVTIKYLKNQSFEFLK